MTEEIKRDEISKIFQQLSECKKALKHGSIQSCLLSFKVLLERTLTTKMLPSDEKQLLEEVNDYQRLLSESKVFKDEFGPVSFHAKDLKSSLDFVKQLIRVEYEKLREEVDLSQKDDTSIKDVATDIEAEALLIMKLIDQGEYDNAKEIVAGNDVLITFIIQTYNRNGIRLRKGEAYDQAIGEFEKALIIQPDDEGLHYNIARVRIQKNEWQLAESSIQEALKINPLFREGNDLLKYIKLHQGK